MIKRLILYFLLFFSLLAQAQPFKVQGKAMNIRLEPLSYATIQVKEFETGGLITKQDGSYELQLAAGTYHLLVTAIGYKSQEVAIVVNSPMQKDIILEEEAQSLGEVIVKARAKDRAEEIMRQVIRKKDSIQAASGPYTCNVYIKATEQPIGNKKSDKEKSNDDDWKNMSMAEILLKMDVSSDNRIKEERLGVRQNGDTKRLFYLSVTDGNFNFYNNLVKVPNISPTPFLSPISFSGLIAYKFKTIRVKRNGKHRIYTLSVKPMEVTNATVEGEITVSDSAWVVLHARFRFPEYHLQEFDFFEVEQEFGFVDSTAWMMSRQEFTYYSKGRSKTYSGHTV
ncbi:MAG: carboxypeptidase-like regulatory domain-containing protein, partial [Sphingobacteriales bacterium]